MINESARRGREVVEKLFRARPFFAICSNFFQ